MSNPLLTSLIVQGLAVLGLLGGAGLALALLPWSDAEVTATARALGGVAERTRAGRERLVGAHS